MKFLKPYVCLTLTFSISAFAQTTNLGSEETKNIFAKMSSDKVADLSLRNFTGTCKAVKLPGGSSAYILTYREGTQTLKKRFGLISKQVTPLPQVLPQNINQNIFLQEVHYKAPSRLELFVSELKSNLFISDAHAIATSNLSLPLYAMPLHSFDFLKSAKSQMGSFVKSLIAQNKCGTVVFEKFSQSITDMRDDVTFYKDGNKIRCSAAGFVRNIRNPQTCTTQVIRSELPEKACMNFYQRFSQVNGRNATTQSSSSSSSSTSTSSSSSSTTTAPSTPIFAAYTDAIKEEFAVSAVLQGEPEIEYTLASADLIKADHAVDVEAIQVIEQKPISALSFTNGSLSQLEVQHLANLQATHLAIKQDLSYVQFSPDVQAIFNNTAIKTALNSYIASNNIVPQVFSIPKVTALQEHIGLELQPLQVIYGASRPIRLDLGCISEMIQVERISTSSALQM